MPKLPPVYRPPIPGGKSGVHARQKKTAALSGDRNRPHSRARGYDRAWERLRARHLANNPWCVFCLRKGIVTPATVGDHIETIEDRPDLRLDDDNVQSLCKPCHDGEKQRQDAAARRSRRAPPNLT